MLDILAHVCYLIIAARETENRKDEMKLKGERKMKTMDKYEVKVGMWISDVNGIYEVKKIHGDYTVVNLIEFEENPEDYHIADTLIKTEEEITKCSYM